MEEIQGVLDEYFSAWNEGFKSKDGEGIRGFMSRDFAGYWAHSEIKKPDSYGYDYDLDAVLRQMDDARKSFETVSITTRKEGVECLVLGRETNLIQGVPYSAECMFVWRKEQDGWKLVREYIELER
ncbi:nuclear transport factor 2 family protein [Bacillus sp. H-16]|uniref:nuclear transport factor 2 family protein n=1 Tax=Alteribacter salitolerans TaxID=2912333 RepID=UPI0019648683|nr:nuclear transport factor 2 family protein [Alteribacter salitolerans]MBM7095106.1 nuclear transport factor 2 family protein [Alteribacter salitolerans]